MNLLLREPRTGAGASRRMPLVVTLVLAVVMVLAALVLTAGAPAEAAASGQAWLFTTARTYGPAQKPEIGVRGQSLKTLSVSVYSFDGAAYFSSAGEEGLWGIDVARLPGRKLVKQVSVPIDRKGQPARSSVVLDPLPPGCYVAVPVSPQVRSTYAVWFTVSGFGLVTKESAGSLLVYAVDTLTGASVAGVDVTATLYPEVGYEPEWGADSDTPQGPVKLSGTTDEDGLWRVSLDTPAASALVMGVRGQEVQVANSYYWYDSRLHKVFVYTDRPVYRPGNTVHFKGIVRAMLDPGYKTPDPATVSVEVMDPEGNRIYREDLSTGAWGSFDGSLSLAAEPPLGRYSIVANINGEQHWSGFDVAEYRKPEWSVEVKFDEPRYVAGDRLEAELSTMYYFGSPVQNASVNFRVYRQRTGFLGYAGTEMADEESQYYAGQEMYWQEYVTSGTAATDDSGRARLSFDVPNTAPGGGNYIYTVIADVADSTGKTASGSGWTLVVGGLFDAEVSVDQWVMSPGVEFTARVRTVDASGKPCSQALVVKLMKRTWHKKGYTDSTVMTRQVTTSARGEGEVTLKVTEPGEYVVTASAVDERGNHVEASAWVWASKFGVGVQSERTDLAVVIDKPKYSVGDTALVLISGPAEAQTALVTVEDTDIRLARVVPLEQGSASVELPIEAAYAPNTFVNVTVVSGGIMQAASAEVVLDDPSTSLTVEIQPNKTQYRPGETATFLVTTRDSNGDAMPAEVSFALVDEAIFAVRPDTTSDIVKFFHGKRQQAVTTENSFPATYYGGADKEGAAESDRKDFPDTAAWYPSVVTDANGHAVIKITLPDSLTTWRATVRAHSRTTMVGQATAKVKVSLPLSVRLGLPRFYTLGDSGSVTAVVHNDTKWQRTASVTLRADGADIVGPAKKYVKVAPFSSATVEWTVMPRSVGEVKFSARIRSWFTTDGIELRVPVQPFGEPGSAVRAGDTGVGGGDAEVSLDLPERVVAGSLKAWVDVSSGYLGIVSDALEYLVAYPYGCVEQTMSAFVPDIVASQVEAEFGVSARRSAEQLAKMVGDGLARLYGMQHADGGFGWWEYDKSDAWMTSYVLYGYALAKQAGYDVSEGSVSRALQYLSSTVLNQADQRKQAFAFYVLALHGRTNDQMAAAMKKLLPKVTDSQTLAFLGLAAGARGDQELAAAAVKRLAAQASRADGQAIWRTDDPKNPWRNESSESTAWALMALLSTGYDDELAAEAARHLAAARRGDRWLSTRDSAAAVMALVRFVSHTGEKADAGAPAVTITVNGKQAVSGLVRVDGSTRVQIDSALLGAGLNMVRVHADGGRVYFSVAAEWHGEASDVAAAGDSAMITREYLIVDRSLPLDKQGRPATSPANGTVRVGQEVLVRVRVKALENLEYMAFEDPIPSGFEVSGDYSDPYSWSYWYHRREVRDNRVVVFAGSIAKGQEREYEYVITPERAGDYRIMPSTAWSMYYPDQYARGTSATLKVLPR
jgi:uncharacterized protein YfaS (alpha-2-macroglobulin family)